MSDTTGPAGAQSPSSRPSDSDTGVDSPPITALPTAPLSRVPRWLVRLGSASWFTLGILALLSVLVIGAARISALLTPLVVAVVMGMLFRPAVDRLQSHGIPRAIGAGVVLIALFMIGGVVLWLGIAGVIDQGPEIVSQLDEGWSQVQAWLLSYNVDLSSLQNILDTLGESGGGLGGFAASTFSTVASFLIGAFIGTFLLYYLLKDWHIIIRWVASHSGLPEDLGEGLIEDATRSIRRYYYGLTVSGVAVAVLIGLAMALLGLPLAVTIALVTFATAYIPYLGAIFSGAFATLVALGSGGITQAIIVLIVVLGTQNVVQTIIQTKVTSDQLQIHPIVNLGSTIVGATFAGILGATLSAPIVAMVISAQKRVRDYHWAPEQDLLGHPEPSRLSWGAVTGRLSRRKGDPDPPAADDAN